MTRLRAPLATLLVLALALAGVTLAGARGQTPPPGTVQVVICSGTTITVITLDAEGNPVEERRLCPDYGQALLAALPDAPLPARAAMPPARLGIWPAPATPRRAAGRLRPMVRAPPARAA